MEKPIFNPTKIIAIGLNYRDHAQEFNMKIPTEPLIFIKPATTVIGHEDAIIYPPETAELDYEGEMAIVVGARAHRVSVQEAHQYIAGYTCANDVTARDLQRTDKQWTRAKSFDTFCPLGPEIVSGIDPMCLDITTRLNGVVKQHSNTKNLIFDVFHLLSFISCIMTLLPGDVIITGTSSGVGPMGPGDVVEVEIEGIGVLRNTVKKE